MAGMSEQQGRGQFGYPMIGTVEMHPTMVRALKVRVRLAGWAAMREMLPREQWCVDLCDAIADAAADAVLKQLQDWGAEEPYSPGSVGG